MDGFSASSLAVAPVGMMRDMMLDMVLGLGSGLELQSAGDFQASGSFGPNADPQSWGTDERPRRGDFGPGNTSMGRSGSSEYVLASAVSRVEHCVACCLMGLLTLALETGRNPSFRSWLRWGE